MRARTLRTLASVAALFAIVASCGEQSSPTAPAAPPNASLVPLDLSPLTKPVTGLLGGTLELLTCTASQTAIGINVVGPNGGTVRVGPHTLIIPRGALTRPTLIEGISLPGPFRQVSFLPEGLRFSQPVSLQLDYAGCRVTDDPLQVVYLGDRGNLLEIEPSTDDRAARTVTGRIRHFSSYAIAY